MNTPSNTLKVAAASGYGLITRERTAKLELLKHLVANLAHTIIVCGPEGVGKTRLLSLYKDAFEETSLLCYLQGDSVLNLEKLQTLISDEIALKMPYFKDRSLFTSLERLVQRDAKAVVIIDDAGNLAPGVMEQIIVFASEYPALRVVFALTHSELYLKNTTDPSVDDCYQIEIPPLTMEQCEEYLEYLSTLPDKRIVFNAINETVVADLYRKTHGIPGNILTALPPTNNRRKYDNSRAILSYAVASLIVIALGVQWWSSRPRISTDSLAANQLETVAKQAEVSTKQKDDNTISRPGLTRRARNDVIADSRSHGVSIEQDLKSGEDSAIASSPDESQKAAAESVKLPEIKSIEPDPKTNNHAGVVSVPTGSQVVAVPPQLPTPASVELDANDHWLMQQPVENYTLQLMALFDQQAIIEVMHRHQDLGLNLKLLKTQTKKGRDRFILLYGSFASVEQANLESRSLPKALQKTWLRKIAAVQGELSIAAPLDIPE